MSSSATCHRPRIMIIGIQNRKGMLASRGVFSWRNNAGDDAALRQDFVIGSALNGWNLFGLS
jgi:hypothetical protein